MISGRLDRRITIQEYTETTNDYGETVKTWADVVTVWAEVRQQSAREIWQAGKVAETEKMFRIRYRSGIDSTMRVVYDGKNYEITGEPREIGRRDGLEIQGKVQE